ncbi:uncharacterized protein TNCV_4710781 [Trichonephila clavipes]|uniref:Uncharacterized protein n=1 Tax=Trichonephila clavipes TaxID=2585209 RepID=A0A8X6S1E4_TRICX|nr:uncharacterized protein TNCV_4710781 [Trichonephila clavipes]
MYCNDFRHRSVNRLLCGYEPHIQRTPTILNYCAVLSWIVQETFDTTRYTFLFHPLTGCNSRIKGIVRGPPRDPSDGRENRRWSENFVKSGPQKVLPHKQNLDSNNLMNKFHSFNV